MLETIFKWISDKRAVLCIYPFVGGHHAPHFASSYLYTINPFWHLFFIRSKLRGITPNTKYLLKLRPNIKDAKTKNYQLYRMGACMIHQYSTRSDSKRSFHNRFENRVFAPLYLSIFTLVMLSFIDSWEKKENNFQLNCFNKDKKILQISK